MAHGENEAELGKIGGLKLEKARIDPSARAVDVAIEDEDDDEDEDAKPIADVRPAREDMVIDEAEEGGGGESGTTPNDLADPKQVVPTGRGGIPGRGAKNESGADRHQPHDGEQLQPID